VRFSRLLVCAPAALAVSLSLGCNGDGKATLDGLGNVNVDGKVEICDGLTLDQIFEQDTLSEDCRSKIAGFLPDPQTNFRATLVPLGRARSQADGSVSFYLAGVDEAGRALDAAAFASASVSVRVGGRVEALAEGGFTLRAVAEAPADQIAIGLVNDYSASMFDVDLDAIATMQKDLFTLLPPAYEAELTLFSELVEVKQPFTADKNALLAAVARDDDFERATTALYDGMGAGLASLAARERPVKLLFVNTDGAENASTKYDRAGLVREADAKGVTVVMLGALLADVDELKALKGEHGFYFYTPFYSSMRDAVAPLFSALANVVELRLPPERANAEAVEVGVGGQSASLTPPASP
jgi:von Willebrand factor type A domain-containing protein